MERSKAEAVIEAILFTMGDSVEISRLAEVIEEDVKTTWHRTDTVRQFGTAVYQVGYV